MLTLVPIAALALTISTLATAAEVEGDRTRELLRYRCSSDFGAHDLTLFGNGTLRLWETNNGKRTMSLAELTSDELQSYLERLTTEPYDRSQTSLQGGPSGEWVEQCQLRLAISDAEPTEYRFSRVESLSLDLANRLTVVDEMLALTRIRDRGMSFPHGYVPQAGDVLVRKDGSRFRIERYTADGRGLEITGIDEPLVLYIEATQVTGEFSGLEERAVNR